MPKPRPWPDFRPPLAKLSFIRENWPVVESPAPVPAKLAETAPWSARRWWSPTVNGNPWLRNDGSPVNLRLSKTMPASDVGLAVSAYSVTEVTLLGPCT